MKTYGLYIMLGVNVLLIAALVVYHIRYRRLKKIKEDAIDFWTIQCFLLEADINYSSFPPSLSLFLMDCPVLFFAELQSFRLHHNKC